ncbi:MAG TPA: ISL3 family transposase [Geminicoccaceae bacterium]|nr:ISL3 family transposase [Geminicoccaceae bacterium]
MRVSTAFNRMLRLPEASVIGIAFAAEGVIVTVRLRRRRRVCSTCGQVGAFAIHDRRVKRWRHLDLGATRCFVECELRRLWCRDCGGPRLEPVPWARPGASYTRDFEDLVAFLAQQMAKTPIARLLRIAWDTVGRIVERVVAEHLDERRLEGLLAVGVDEISYRKGQRFLTCVADHARGAVIWARPGRNAATLQAFFDELGERKRAIRAVSIDMSAGYENAIKAAVPDAEICFDPFHVVKLANEAVNEIRRVEWNARGKSKTPEGRWLKGARWALLKAPQRLTERQQTTLAAVQHANRPLDRAYLLKEELRALYHLDDRTAAPEHLRAWLAWASRSQLKPFVTLARTIRRYRDGILAAIRLGINNARLEGLNSKVRLISHRSFGFHGPDPLIALIHLCAGGITIDPPFTTNS